MDALTIPLERVVEATEHFVRTPSVRLLVISTSEILRTSVLQHVCAAELFEFNTTPFFVLEAAATATATATADTSADDDWVLRSEELRIDWEALAKSAPPGTLPALWRAETAPTGLVRFGLELGRALAATRAPVMGLTIVLAPVWITAPERWRADLLALVSQRGLERARFIVVESDSAYTFGALETLQRAFLRPKAPPTTPVAGPIEHVDARVDEAALVADAKERLEAMKSTPAGATGPRVVGAAGPDVTPPRRIKQPAPLTHEQAAEKAKELGVPAAYLIPERMQKLQVLILGAALAVREGDHALALRTQREAVDFCLANDLAREAVVNELVLGGYALQRGLNEAALGIYRAARTRAESHAFAEQAVQAQMGAAAALLLMRRTDDAATAYAEAGQLGAKLGSVVLAIEAFRMCGQLLASLGRLDPSARAFRRAIDAAEAGGADAAGSTAPEAARALAAMCRKHGLHAQASALDAQAEALEVSAQLALLPPPVERAATEPAGEN